MDRRRDRRVGRRRGDLRRADPHRHRDLRVDQRAADDRHSGLRTADGGGRQPGHRPRHGRSRAGQPQPDLHLLGEQLDAGCRLFRFGGQAGQRQRQRDRTQLRCQAFRRPGGQQHRHQYRPRRLLARRYRQVHDQLPGLRLFRPEQLQARGHTGRRHDLVAGHDARAQRHTQRRLGGQLQFRRHRRPDDDGQRPDRRDVRGHCQFLELRGARRQRPDQDRLRCRRASGRTGRRQLDSGGRLQRHLRQRHLLRQGARPLYRQQWRRLPARKRRGDQHRQGDG